MDRAIRATPGSERLPYTVLAAEIEAINTFAGTLE